MKYTPEITKRITSEYLNGRQGLPGTQKTIAEIASGLLADGTVTEPEGGNGAASIQRSLIAKLSSLGVYQKKGYLTKRGEVPVKKGEHIETLAELLEVAPEMLESLEKVNKSVLVLLINKLKIAVE